MTPEITNATYLTEKHSNEVKFWTPCILDFFIKCKPELPISECIIDKRSNDEIRYKRRSQDSELIIKDAKHILHEEVNTEFLHRIDNIFNTKLSEDVELLIKANIYPDIIVITSNKVYLVENKPYYGSDLTGPQEACEAYCQFVKRLNNKEKINCEYLMIISACFKKYYKLENLQKCLKNKFGVLLLEDIFQEMHNHKFKYDDITEDWGLYTDKAYAFLEVGIK
ncbi:Uncharacterized protein dnl_32010 [Desulfonema limicola]|uniref:Uncharacterized protein n=1 Tax=Desulfonema limicola TaxID=45656 RepID=A0A975B8Z9_9BACT|nr:hypothetical protein [Desulfonema limicola]QTA80886.1 Uncharacterized protein dnl_32010 [Desulfonema limicola]